MTSSNAVLDRVQQGALSPAQVVVIAVCLVINMIDGFDIVVISFVASEIANEWALSPGTLGVLFSAGLAGMTLGSLFISPMADRFGRRPIILTCLAVTTFGMVVSAFANNVNQLMFLRLLSGMGIGGILSSLIIMVAEYSPNDRRQFAITLSLVGFPIGAIVGGSFTVLLIEQFGWRAPFLAAGCCTLVMIPAVLLYLPESLAFLLSSRKDDTLERVNRILQRLDKDVVESLPEPPQSATRDSNKVAALFSRELRQSTMLIWMIYFLGMLAMYFVINWTPKLIFDAGLSREQGIYSGIVINVGALVGILTMSALSLKVSMVSIVATYMLCGAAAMTVFGAWHTDLVVVMALAFVIGFMINSSLVGMHAMVPEMYPVWLRSTGAGWAMGVGRFSAVLAPALAGWMLGTGVSTTMTFVLFALPLVLAALIVWRFLGARFRTEEPD